MIPIILFLGKKNYICGDNITWVDFVLLELIDFVEFLTSGEFSSENKPIPKYIKRIKGKRQLKKYIASDKYFAKPFNNKIAKINNL